MKLIVANTRVRVWIYREIEHLILCPFCSGSTRYEYTAVGIYDFMYNLCARGAVQHSNADTIMIAYLIPLEFLYGLFEQLGILYSDCAERQVPLEYLDVKTYTRISIHEPVEKCNRCRVCIFGFSFSFFFTLEQMKEEREKTAKYISAVRTTVVSCGVSLGVQPGVGWWKRRRDAIHRSTGQIKKYIFFS